MGRLKGSQKGLTLAEVVIAMSLSAVVFLTASNVLIYFGKFTSSVVKSDAGLMGTALGSFEEIVRRIESANEVAIKGTFTVQGNTITSEPITTFPNGCAAGSCIQIRVSPSGPASATDTHANDKVYTYWKTGTNLMRQVDSQTALTIARNITSLVFAYNMGFYNQISISLNAVSESETRENLYTVAILRSRSANLVP